ncbi:MAG: hypothetical protein Cons2KO_14620 [Congregibacter sp.]
MRDTEAIAGNNSANEALGLDSVSKRFGELQVLHDVDLSIPRNKACAIVGPSGCGKSTLLRLFNGLVEADSGVVRAFGEPVSEQALPQLCRRMGYAVQGTGLFPHMTARENITLAAHLGGWSEQRIDTRLQALFDLMHLDADLLPRFPHELSGGQQQRVGLCRAMMLEPEVLLLDEPFAAIDPITRHDIHRQLLEILEAEPVTVVLVTHDMREAMLLADRIVIMVGGAIALDQAADELRDRYPGLEPEVLLQNLMREHGL